MGFRFRRSLKIAPGVRLNFSNSGTSVSVGPRGAKLTVSKKGTRTTVGLPGSGLSHTTFRPHQTSSLPPSGNTGGGFGGWLLAGLVVVVLVALL